MANEAKRKAAAIPTDLAAKVGRLGDRVIGARRVAHEALVREAATRSELTLALIPALVREADARAQLRAMAAKRNMEAARNLPLRRRTRFSRRFDELLTRFKARGQARIILRAGVWHGSGDPEADLKAVTDYVERGADPAAQPAVLFDQAWYLETYPDVTASGLAPLVHYLLRGADEGRGPHPLFDVGRYVALNGEALAASGISPLEHYHRLGAACGRDPHPLFEVGHYLAQAADYAPQIEDPLSHYLRIGWTRGLSPHPLFDPAWYRRRLAEDEVEGPPLVHYLTRGWKLGLSPHPLFDPTWYLARNPDVAEAQTDPLSHYVAIGARELREPTLWFDSGRYKLLRGGDWTDRNPLIDYLQGGAWALAEARPGFATAAYLCANPEIALEGLTPLEHWARRSQE